MEVWYRLGMQRQLIQLSDCRILEAFVNAFYLPATATSATQRKHALQLATTAITSLTDFSSSCDGQFIPGNTKVLTALTRWPVCQILQDAVQEEAQAARAHHTQLQAHRHPCGIITMPRCMST